MLSCVRDAFIRDEIVCCHAEFAGFEFARYAPGGGYAG